MAKRKAARRSSDPTVKLEAAPVKAWKRKPEVKLKRVKVKLAKGRALGGVRKAKPAKSSPKGALRRIEVKLAISDLRLVNGAIKKLKASKNAWLRDTLVKAAQEIYGGAFSGKHKIDPVPDRTVEPVGIVAQGEDVPHADDEDVDEVEESFEPTQPTSLAVHGPPTGGANLPVVQPPPGPTLSAPAPQWAMGRVAPPVWQQPQAPRPPAPPADDDSTLNGQGPVQ